VSSLRSTIAVAAFVGSALHAQQPQRANIYFIIAADTLTAERVERTAGTLSFQIFDLKRRSRVDVTARTAPEGLLADFDWRAFTGPNDTTPVARATVTFSGDSVRVERNGSANWVRIGAGAVPAMNVSGALIEQTILRARSMAGDSVTIPGFIAPWGPVLPMTVLKRSDTTYTIRLGIAVIEATVSRDGLLQSASIPAQGARYVRAPAAPVSVAEAKSFAPPAGAPYTAQEVTIRTSAGLTLRGTLTLPPRAGGSRLPAIVTITGSGPQDRDATPMGLPRYHPYYQLADTLGRRGIAVLRLDDRGAGSDPGPPTVTTADFADDIRAAVAWLRARPEIDPGRVGLVGHSEGGTIAPMVAASDSAIAAVIILAGPISTGREIVAFQNAYLLDSVAHLAGQRRDAALMQASRQADSAAAKLPWYRFFFDYDGTAAARRVQAPVLILHGEKDYQVPVAEAEKLAAAIRDGGNRDVTVRVFPGLNHLFLPYGGPGFSYEKLPSFVVNPEVMGAIADWLSMKLSARVRE
jgi:uncharacterized protein